MVFDQRIRFEISSYFSVNKIGRFLKNYQFIFVCKSFAIQAFCFTVIATLLAPINEKKKHAKINHKQNKNKIDFDISRFPVFRRRCHSNVMTGKSIEFSPKQRKKRTGLHIYIFTQTHRVRADCERRQLEFHPPRVNFTHFIFHFFFFCCCLEIYLFTFDYTMPYRIRLSHDTWISFRN